MTPAPPPVFGLWYETMKWLFATTDRFPKKVRGTFTRRVEDHALDILELIIRARYDYDRPGALRECNLRLEELRVLLRLAHDFRYISDRQSGYISERLTETGAMVGGWLKHAAARP